MNGSNQPGFTNNYKFIPTPESHGRKPVVELFLHLSVRTNRIRKQSL